LTRSDGGVHEIEPLFGIFFAMATPAFSEPLGPCLNKIVTVPEVVGVQLICDGVPATKDRPDVGILKGLGPFGEADCAVTIVARAATKTVLKKRILGRKYYVDLKTKGGVASNKQ